MLFRFRRYYIFILLFLFVGLTHLNGFPNQNRKLTDVNSSWVSDSRVIAQFFNTNTSCGSDSFLTYNSRDRLIEIEGSRHYSSHFPTASKNKIYTDVDNYLIDNAAFRDYTSKTLAYSVYFAPVKDIFLELCIFRL